MTSVGMHEAKTNLSKLVERALAGEEIVIARNGIPLIQLTPLPQASDRRSVLGVWKGKVRMADDFDDFDDELAEMFGVR